MTNLTQLAVAMKELTWNFAPVGEYSRPTEMILPVLDRLKPILRGRLQKDTTSGCRVCHLMRELKLDRFIDKGAPSCAPEDTAKRPKGKGNEDDAGGRPGSAGRSRTPRGPLTRKSKVEAGTVDLKPGRYVAVGNRDGYRDVRRNFNVMPASIGNPEPIELSCKEPI